METVLLPTKKDPPATTSLKNLLLISGLLSTLWYFIISIIVPLQDPAYNISSQTVSELSAIDAPTRSLWVILCIPFTLLSIAFGIGIWLTAGQNRKLRFVAAVIIFDAVFGSFWPPMHQREVIAAGGSTLTDTLHLVWTFVHLVFVLLMIGFAAAALGKRFRLYSIATVVAFIVFGVLTAMESSGIEAGTPTPLIGVWERINMGAYMLWVAVFAIALLQKNKVPNTTGKGSNVKNSRYA